jgi:hypothetical protein
MDGSIRSYIDLEEQLLRDYLNAYNIYDIEKEAIVQASFFLRKELQTGQPAVEKISLFHFLRRSEETKALLRGEERKAMEYFVQLLEKWEELYLVKVHFSETGSEVIEFINPEYEKILAFYVNASSERNFSFPKGNSLSTNKKYYRYHKKPLKEINLTDILKFSKEKAVIEISLQDSENILFPSRGWQMLIKDSLKNCTDYFPNAKFNVIFRKAISNLKTETNDQTLNEENIVSDFQQSMSTFPLSFYSRFFDILSSGLKEIDDFPEKKLLFTSVSIVDHAIHLKEEIAKEQKKSAERQLQMQALIHFIEKQPQPIHRDYLFKLNTDEDVKKIFDNEDNLNDWPATVDKLLKSQLIKKNEDHIRSSTFIPVIDGDAESFIMAGKLIRLILNRIDHLALECKNDLRTDISEKLISGESIEYLSSLELLEHKLETMIETKNPLISFALSDHMLFRKLISDILDEYKRPKLNNIFYPNGSQVRVSLTQAFKIEVQGLLEEAQSSLPFYKRLWYVILLGRDRKLMRQPKKQNKIVRKGKPDSFEYQELTIKEDLHARYLQNLHNHAEIAGALDRLKYSWNSLESKEAHTLEASIQGEADAIIYLNREKVDLNDIKIITTSINSAISILVKKYDRSVENSHSLKKYLETYIVSALIEKVH